jgi:hypothetical protein
MKRESAMIYRRSVCVLLALLTAHGVVAQPLATSGKDASSQQVEIDLTGYWQQEDGQIFYFSQDGSSLTSRHSHRSASNDKNDVEFTATIYGDLVYGAHRAAFSPALLEKCSSQIWVGMGLTLNDKRTALTGFRGDRIVDPENCDVEDSEPVGLAYVRIDPPES